MMHTVPKSSRTAEAIERARLELATDRLRWVVRRAPATLAPAAKPGAWLRHHPFMTVGFLSAAAVFIGVKVTMFIRGRRHSAAEGPRRRRGIFAALLRRTSSQLLRAAVGAASAQVAAAMAQQAQAANEPEQDREMGEQAAGRSESAQRWPGQAETAVS